MIGVTAALDGHLTRLVCHQPILQFQIVLPVLDKAFQIVQMLFHGDAVRRGHHQQAIAAYQDTERVVV